MPHSRRTVRRLRRSLERAVIRNALLAVCVALLSGLAWLTNAGAAGVDDSALHALLHELGVEASAVVPDRARIETSATRAQQLPFYRALMDAPLRAHYRVGMLDRAVRDAIESPHSLLLLAGTLTGANVWRTMPTSASSAGDAGDAQESAGRLALALDAIAPGQTADGAGWELPSPDDELADSLRTELTQLLEAISVAEQFRQRALVAMPPELTPGLLLRQAIDGQMAPFEAPDFRQLLPALETAALLAGMQDLVAATQRMLEFIETADHLPKVAWRVDTPMGPIVIDTTGADNRHTLVDPLLVIDVGGNDHYDFSTRLDARRGRISVLIDVGGDDVYLASEDAACPSAAVMGFGILWDTDGNDRYEGQGMAQSAALFGASLLVDGGGSDHFSATGHAQAFAMGGLALLLSRQGNDAFDALTHAQGSAGPGGVALLINADGDDRYRLGNEPLVSPSSQLPERNVSMGQGAGRGLRADQTDGRSMAGGIGALFDLAGDDHYIAQVFAQGAGFWEGAGLLVDGGGNDRFVAAWYSMAASAHLAAGVLLNLGGGDDEYAASHSTSIGAAHDLSIAFFLDDGGADSYKLGNLGLGAGHDNGVGVFVDLGGDDTYVLAGELCRGLGYAAVSQPGSLRKSLTGIGLFFDLGGDDRYPDHCYGAANDRVWHGSRAHPDLNLPSEIGAGLDGSRPNSFWTGPLIGRSETSDEARR